ncbi:uncharacterized protein LOC134787749 [Penaeus indicus]|uniref:uncharacterized protein LOC134787749 n=1 Tax=Penaeus indicus TaxID=29960 RepID=UPI00300BFDAA
MQAIRIAPKLTDSHVNLNSCEKMRVNYACQIFSRTGASGIHSYATLGGLPRETEATAEFINIMNELFDVFNSSTKHHYRSRKCAIAKNNDNIEFLKKAREWVMSWKIVGTNRYIPSVHGWLLNIASIQALWEDLSINNHLDYLLTRRINQDCLENYFYCIRKSGGNNYTASITNFISATKNLSCSSLLKDAENGNCDDDRTPLIIFVKYIHQEHHSPSHNDSSLSNGQINHEINTVGKLDESEEVLHNSDKHIRNFTSTIHSAEQPEAISHDFNCIGDLLENVDFTVGCENTVPDFRSVDGLLQNFNFDIPSITSNEKSNPNDGNMTCFEDTTSSIDDCNESLENLIMNFNYNITDEETDSVISQFDYSQINNEDDFPFSQLIEDNINFLYCRVLLP